MPVIDASVGDLDNESDLMNWLAAELVANHHFVERRRLGSVAANDLVLVLERDIGTTYHGDHYITLLLEKGTNTEGTTANTSSFRFNVGHGSYEECFYLNAAAAITIDVDPNEDNTREAQVLTAPAGWEDPGVPHYRWDDDGGGNGGQFTTGGYLRIVGSNIFFGVSSFVETDEPGDTIVVDSTADFSEHYYENFPSASISDGGYTVVHERRWNDSSVPTLLTRS